MNKDRIKERILKRAAQEWGSKEIDSETSFDPIVSMLLNAVSFELEKVYGEFNNIQTRVIERVLDIIFPDTVAVVYPSRAIVHVEPIENNYILSTQSHLLTCVKKINNIYDPANPSIKNVSLAPTANFISHAAKIEFMAYGKSFHRVENYFSKTNIFSATNHIDAGIIWIGIKCKNDATNFKNMMFYTDIRNEYQKDFFFYNLKQVRCYHGTKEIKIKEGYNINNQSIDIKNIVQKNYSYIDQISTEINDYFVSNFITLEDTVSINDQNDDIIAELSNHFYTDIFKEEKDIIWLKFVFPETLVTDIVDNMQISLNCFPFLNKEPYLKKGRIIDTYFYMPLITDDYFLDLNRVDSDSGISYHLKEYTNGLIEDGCGTVRKSGVSRFDERNASELLSYLLEVTKDEVASFSGIGGDVMIKNIKMINQGLASIHQTIKEKNAVTSNAPYLMLKKSVDEKLDAILNIDFFGTCGYKANDIKPFTRLSTSNNDGAFSDDSAYLITPTFAGKKGMSNEDKVLSYRYNMLTRGKVVTPADIKAFTLNHFKSTISTVEVSKGTKKENSIKEGFSRTIDIKIKKNVDASEIKVSEWKYLCDSFLMNIVKVSSNIYPYRLIEIE